MNKVFSYPNIYIIKLNSSFISRIVLTDNREEDNLNISSMTIIR